jgi:hypothetical protein
MGALATFFTAVDAIRDHWFQILVVSLLTCVAVAIWGGDGAPIDSKYPFVGQGLLKPWMNWSTADRWRLHEYEPVAYEKVSFCSRLFPCSCYLTVNSVQQERNPMVCHLLGFAISHNAPKIPSRFANNGSTFPQPCKSSQ